MFDFGMNRAVFRANTFERTPLWIRRSFDPSPYGWSMINQALDMQDPTRELLKVLNKGRIDPAEYVEEFVDVGIRRRRVLKERLYSFLSTGATIVLNRIELVSLPVRDICLEVGRFVGAQTTANAYASFGGEPATNVHWDTHDVFIVQIGGKKRWRLYQPTHPLPLSSQVSNDRKDEVPENPIFDELVEAGDVLYVPRGWWHRVEPVEGCETLHLTVAVHTPLILDYLVWACASVLPDHVEMRHSLLGDEQDGERVAAAAAVAMKALQDPETLKAFYARSQQRERVVSSFDIEALVSRTDGDLGMTTRVTLNTRHADDQSQSIRVNGKTINLVGDHHKIVKILAGTTSMEVANIRELVPDLSPSAIDAVLRDLARADIISFSGPAGTRSDALQVAARCSV